MKKWKSVVMICLLIASLSIPASAFAASGYDYSHQNSFDALLDSVFSFFFGSKDTKYDYGNSHKNSYQTNTYKYDGKYYWLWTGWGWKKYSKKEWEDCFKHIPKESKDIWKEWYCW